MMRRSGADEIRHGEHGFAGIRDGPPPWRRGCSRLRLGQPARGEGGMHDAGALPDLHVLAAGLLLDVVAQVAVGQEQHGLLRRESSSRSCTALREVQRMSLSAFTSIEVLM